MKALPNYLRMYRKRAGFTQVELAYLLGVRSAGKISRHEHFAQGTTLEAALAYEAIVGVSVRKLFAGTYAGIEHEVKKRARRLRRHLVKQQVHRRKLATIDAILNSSDEDVTYVPLR